MAGHSKWSNIQHRKKAQDAKRGKLFTKLIREIVVATKEGGPDKESNPRLRLAIDKAYQGNMTRDTVEKAIARGAGNQDDSQYFEVTYEGYAPHGIAILVECLTDNRNRTVGEVRHIFNKYGGNLGTEGSVSYLFSSVGVIIIQKEHCPKEINSDKLFELAIDAGANDFSDESDHYYISTDRDKLSEVYTKIKEHCEVSHAETTKQADIDVTITNDQFEVINVLLEKLEDLDDVQNVFSNLSTKKTG